MSLAAGVRLGPYEITALLGAGGMGEVYKARDTRLDRVVAIKVLPEHFAADAQFRERFEREARAISALDHPNICTLYDVGHEPLRRSVLDTREDDGPSASGVGAGPHAIDFLVMQFLEGEALESRLTKGALPIDQALTIAIQVASALDKAHRAGIVHRDLKPGNIMLTKAGPGSAGSPHAKLLDFGLAKAAAPAGAASGLSMLPTTPANLTAQGTLLGTFQYMAPEQLDGQEADARTDIFAFGAVLYEMLTGRKAFAGKSNATLIAAIVGSDPPAISTLLPVVPAALDRVVKTCLAKDPDERWQSAGDLVRELKWIAGSGSEVQAQPDRAAASGAAQATARGAGRARWPRSAWAVCALLSVAAIGALVVGWLGSLNRTTEPARRYVSSIVLPDNVRIPDGADHFALSPDGTRLAFVASVTGPQGRGPQQLWIRPLNADSAQPLQGTDGADAPFWSPDSRFVAFNADRKLKKIDITGGPPLTVADATFVGPGAWNKENVIVFNLRGGDGLYQVSASGGTPTPVTKVDRTLGDQGHSKPNFLPDGRHFLYQAGLVNRARAVYVGSLDTSEQPVQIMPGSSTFRYANGQLLIVRQGTLLAQAFDPVRRSLQGDSVAIAEQIAGGGTVGTSAAFSVSDTGVLAYQTGVTSLASSELVWMDRSGKRLGVVGDQKLYGSLELSPDAKRAIVLLPTTGSGRNTWIVDVVRGVTTRFTFDGAGENRAVWSPDGSQIAFGSAQSTSQARFDLFRKSSSGAGRDEPLLSSPENANLTPLSWSPDGQFLLYFVSQGSGDLWVLPLVGDRTPFSLVSTPATEQMGTFSPDGRWVAYVSNESGRAEVYVIPFAGPDNQSGSTKPSVAGKWQISTAGGVWPRWRHDGKELFYQSPDSKLMAASVSGSPTGFDIGATQTLFQTRPPFASGASYVVAPDGQRFLVNTALAPTSPSAPNPITLVVNWMAGLKN